MRIQRVALVAGLISAAPANALAQAWIGEQNDLSFSLTSQLNLLKDLAISDGRVIANLFSATQIDVDLGIEYVPIDNLAVRLHLPLKGTTYTGEQTSMGQNLGGLDFAHGRYDDGSMHFTPTDASLELAYMFFGDTFAVTPFVRGSLPLTDYEWKGYAAAGLHLKQLALGLSLGVTGALITPDLYGLFLQATYSYSLVERVDANAKTEEFNINRSDASVQLGYFVIDPLAIYVGLDLIATHGGVELDMTYATLDPDIKINHDPLLRQSAMFFGGGVFYQVTDTFGANLGVKLMLSAQNVMKATIFQLGLTWSPNFF